METPQRSSVVAARKWFDFPGNKRMDSDSTNTSAHQNDIFLYSNTQMRYVRAPGLCHTTHSLKKRLDPWRVRMNKCMASLW